MEIELPERFDKLLAGEYRALVDNSLSTYSTILKDNKLTFFPDYTDHGLSHIKSVLVTADKLITEESFRFLNEKDIAVLTLAILLHDLGMHISVESFKKLLSGEFDKNKIDFFDSLSWREEWDVFYQEFKRYNDEQLIDIFGHSSVAIEDPQLDNLNDQERRLFGEFLRKLHPRLAHEIAIGGYPSAIGEPNISIPYNDGLREIVDLAGLVARSHGMSIRSATDYLEEHYDEAWKSPLDVKVVYLMVVLRIADYIQIQADRAPIVVLKSKRLGSPVSKQEWEKHNSISDVRANTDDPERLYVVAKPLNSNIFLELEKLFLDIQSEFDKSWAILGEVYGKDEELHQLKIRFRRIRSTLDNKAKFSKQVKYLPEKVVFDADPELLKLLIGPLYGDDPKYGVRELLQNAVDAVKERKYLSESDDVGITISIEENRGAYILTIKDEGIGMSQDTLINYFFRAGASFRKSMFWKRNFIGVDGAEIQKTGRFGVGVLAVFLLGDEFEMYTRYNSKESQGFYCKASLSSKQIEVQKNDCDVGTKIVIRLKDEVQSLIEEKLKEKERGNTIVPLDWFRWYKMSVPKIDFELTKALSGIFRMERNQISADPLVPSLGWYKFRAKDYPMIHWTIPIEETVNKDGASSGQIICNGFVIKRRFNLEDKSYRWIRPIVSIFDNNGKLPLSLNRDYVENDILPFEDLLLEAVSTEIVKSLMEVEFVKKGDYYLPQSKRVKFGRYHLDISEFVVVSGDTYTLLDGLIFVALGVKTFCQMWIKGNISSNDDLFVAKNTFYQASVLPNETNYFYKNKMDSYHHDEARLNNWFCIGEGRFFKRADLLVRTYLHKEKLEYLAEPEKNRLRRSFLKSVAKKTLNENWSTIERKEIQVKIDSETGKRTVIEGAPHRSNLNGSGLSDSYYLIIERFFEDQRSGNSFLINTWLKLLGPNWLIPIDSSKRPSLASGSNVKQPTK